MHHFSASHGKSVISQNQSLVQPADFSVPVDNSMKIKDHLKLLKIQIIKNLI